MFPARRTAVALTAALLAASAATAAAPLPPPPARWVTDEAGFLSPGARERLDRRLQAYEKSSGGRQVIVWIGKSIGDQPLEEWAARTFAAWGVGRKGLDDGVALLLLAGDRKVRIEVGYGLEDRLTDLRASRIIREELVPRLQRGDPDGAVTAAVDRILAVIGGEAAGQGEAQPAAGEPERRKGSLLSVLVWVFVGGIFLFLFITNPSLAVALLMSMGSSGGGRRGGWGGGGGFSGGGGRSGGGGASGSW
jgi:uncharacterized protein